MGGLTVARAIIDLLPDEDIVYIGDTANGPYGPLTIPEIRRHALAIGDDLAARGVKLSLGGQVYDPTDPMGKMFFNILATFAEFEVDLLRMRTREGMAVARAKGRLKGRQPKLTTKQQKELRRMHDTGDYTITDLAEVFKVSRPTVYRTINHNNAKEMVP